MALVSSPSLSSPNHGERRGGAAPGILVLHYTGMPDAQSALARLCAADSEVSAHYLVHEDGCIVQMVEEHRRAWHAGAGSWAGFDDINSHSIGIEIVNPGHDHGYPDFPGVQIDAVIALGLDIVRRHAIRPDRVIAHSDMAPSRKRDPGEKFPWGALHAAGLGHWVPPAPIDGAGPGLRPGDSGAGVRDLQAALRDYGYGIPVDGQYSPATQAVVSAFQRHFRPALVDGIADASTRDTLQRLRCALSGRMAAGDPARPGL